MQHKFENVKGYATYANAQKRGEEIAAQYGEQEKWSWVIIALPNGRFTPMVIANQHTQPGWFASQTNVCIAN